MRLRLVDGVRVRVVDPEALLGRPALTERHAVGHPCAGMTVYLSAAVARESRELVIAEARDHVLSVEVANDRHGLVGRTGMMPAVRRR